MPRLLYQLFIFLFVLAFSECKKLETVTEGELEKLVKSESYVVALFSKPNCEPCLELEHELGMGRELLADQTGAWVVKLVSSSRLLYLYSDTEPAVVFFRKQVPMLYHGPPEDLISTLQAHLDSSLQVLNDDNFEHLTQAGTGATTGDWLVLFHSSPLPTRLAAIWEGAASVLKDKMNVARLDTAQGARTVKRFQIKAPTVILLRHGNYFEYDLEYQMKDLVDFVTGFYRNFQQKKVPVPKSPFDELVETVSDQLKENPIILKVATIFVSISVLFGVFIKYKSAGATTVKKQK